MAQRMLGLLALLVLVAAIAAGQPPEGYLDVFIVKVRPEKRAEMDAIGKRLADANRHHKGDTWLAYQTEYGEQNTLYYVSTRQNYAAIETGFTAFEKAMKEANGATWMKLLQDFNNCVVSTRGELRRRRWDLSRNVPNDPAELNKLIGAARWLRTTIIRVRTGRSDDFEATVRPLNDAVQRADPKHVMLASQSSVGSQGVQYFFTNLEGSLAAFDSIPSLREAVGESGYASFQKRNADNVLTIETIIGRFLPEQSNPPHEVASVAPSFWNPKPAATPKAKTKPAAAAKTAP